MQNGSVECFPSIKSKSMAVISRLTMSTDKEDLQDIIEWKDWMTIKLLKV